MQSPDISKRSSDKVKNFTEIAVKAKHDIINEEKTKKEKKRKKKLRLSGVRPLSEVVIENDKRVYYNNDLDITQNNGYISSSNVEESLQPISWKIT